jgi:hypothetical protein
MTLGRLRIDLSILSLEEVMERDMGIIRGRQGGGGVGSGMEAGLGSGSIGDRQIERLMGEMDVVCKF